MNTISILTSEQEAMLARYGLVSTNFRERSLVEPKPEEEIFKLCDEARWRAENYIEAMRGLPLFLVDTVSTFSMKEIDDCGATFYFNLQVLRLHGVHQKIPAKFFILKEGPPPTAARWFDKIKALLE
ncbi:MAG: hypothetical protein NTZ80_00170 [Patescibacteria group bacterium]|nr:hypothetical protein [Patescibacteria group bacterium]